MNSNNIIEITKRIKKKGLPFSPKKANILLYRLRNLPLKNILKLLQYLDKKIAHYLLEILKEGINALKTEISKISKEKNVDIIKFGEIRYKFEIGRSKKLRRLQPRGRGKIDHFYKHLSNVYLTITSTYQIVERKEVQNG